MRRSGSADLPLHGGKAPRWLFDRMRRLAREIVIGVVASGGPDELLTKISDPVWFQALGCVLGFDWHSSGVTTTVCGALKEGIRGLESELGLFIAGGKGRASRQTPTEIAGWAEHTGVDAPGLIRTSRLVAKVDSAGLQDGFQLYHHCFFFSPRGTWAVVQQGMNEDSRYARRYHWASEAAADMVCEPHSAICSQAHSQYCLNMVAQHSDNSRRCCLLLAGEKPSLILGELNHFTSLRMPRRHGFPLEVYRPKQLEKRLQIIYENPPNSFSDLLAIPGVGAKTVRALALVADLVYGAHPSFKDPATYSFAHGGKDGYPYPVDLKTYESTITGLRNALKRARLGRGERLQALKRLRSYVLGDSPPA
jgi:hypothetical protein